MSAPTGERQIDKRLQPIRRTLRRQQQPILSWLAYKYLLVS
jgi:hypothetical protein